MYNLCLASWKWKLTIIVCFLTRNAECEILLPSRWNVSEVLSNSSRSWSTRRSPAAAWRPMSALIATTWLHNIFSYRKHQIKVSAHLIIPFYLASDFYYQKYIVCYYRKHLTTILKLPILCMIPSGKLLQKITLKKVK